MACAVTFRCVICGAGGVGAGARDALSGGWLGSGNDDDDDEDDDEGWEAEEDCCRRETWRVFARPKPAGEIRTALKCGRTRLPRSENVSIEVRSGQGDNVIVRSVRYSGSYYAGSGSLVSFFTLGRSDAVPCRSLYLCPSPPRTRLILFYPRQPEPNAKSGSPVWCIVS